MDDWGRSLKTSFLICAVLLVCAASVHSEESDSTTVQVREQEPKSPTKAMARSLMLPGWGQFYNGKRFKGTLIAAAEVGSVVALFIRRDQIDNDVRPLEEPPKRNLFVISTIGIVFYSVVDAFVDAHLDGFDWGQLDYNPSERRLFLKVGRRF